MSDDLQCTDNQRAFLLHDALGNFIDSCVIAHFYIEYNKQVVNLLASQVYQAMLINNIALDDNLSNILITSTIRNVKQWLAIYGSISMDARNLIVSELQSKLDNLRKDAVFDCNNDNANSIVSLIKNNRALAATYEHEKVPNYIQHQLHYLIGYLMSYETAWNLWYNIMSTQQSSAEESFDVKQQSLQLFLQDMINECVMHCKQLVEVKDLVIDRYVVLIRFILCIVFRDMPEMQTSVCSQFIYTVNDALVDNLVVEQS